MSFTKPVDYTIADHRAQHRGYMTGLFESQPKPLQYRGPGRAFITLSHWNIAPLEIWMYFMGGRVSPPYPIENRWWLRVNHQHYIYHACKIMKPYSLIHGPMIDEALAKIDVNRDPKVWELDEKWIQDGFTPVPEISYEGIPEEFMIYHRLGYAAAVLERTRTWYRWEDGHITIQIRHMNPEPLQMIAKIANKVGGPDESGGKWQLTMNNQKKIMRFLHLMWPYVKIPHCQRAIKAMVNGQKPENLLDIPIKEWYTLTDAGRKAVGIIEETPGRANFEFDNPENESPPCSCKP